MSLVRMALFVIALAITVPCLEANIGELDEYLQEKANQAHRAALEAYEPDPLNVTSELNFHVHLAMDEVNTNSTRGRDLREKKNRKKRCQATNPIDRCWRCDPNWEKNRFKLASCAMGFGRKATGGLGGPIYVVTDSSDEDLVNPKPGTLRHGVIQKGPLWIIFSRSMVIKLKEELLVSSDKTIDGRGANVAIRNGAGISLQFVNNVIIHNLRIRNIKPKNGVWVLPRGEQRLYSLDNVRHWRKLGADDIEPRKPFHCSNNDVTKPITNRVGTRRRRGKTGNGNRRWIGWITEPLRSIGKSDNLGGRSSLIPPDMGLKLHCLQDTRVRSRAGLANVVSL
ncbi:hypothetical protein K1719_008102 [Acacia pycnantha]|nr:hypothetical protein K1719_008102 [Acacia pycnantha]